MLILRRNEDTLIDAYAPQTDAVAPLATQSNVPGENPQRLGPADVPPPLPDPSVGGQYASGIRNGFNTGFRSFRNRMSPFLGAVAKAPAVTNPVQGEVGRGNSAARLYVGVMNQQVTYNPDQSAVMGQQITGVGKV